MASTLIALLVGCGGDDPPQDAATILVIDDIFSAAKQITKPCATGSGSYENPTLMMPPDCARLIAPRDIDLSLVRAVQDHPEVDVATLMIDLDRSAVSPPPRIRLRSPTGHTCIEELGEPLPTKCSK
jgi:hypothetical protein